MAIFFNDNNLKCEKCGNSRLVREVEANYEIIDAYEEKLKETPLKENFRCTRCNHIVYTRKPKEGEMTI